MRLMTRVTLCLSGVTLALLVIGCSKRADEHLAAGNRYFEAKQFAEAIVEYRSAVQKDPGLGQAHFRLADAYIQVKDPDRAAVEYVKAAQLMPDNLDAQLRAGDMLLLGRRFRETQAVARQALQLDPKNIRALVLNANALAGLKQPELAMAAVERAIQLDPTRADTYGDLGALQLLGDKPDEAEANFARRVELNPTSADARITLASFYWIQGRIADAEAQLMSAYELDPAHVAINRALATFYLGTDRAQRAEEHLRVVVDSTGTPAAQLMLADYYLSLGRPDAAVPVLDQAAGSRDGYAEARSRLATIAYQAGRTAEGHQLIDETLKTEPSSGRALLTKAGFLFQEGKLMPALDRARAALDADPDSLPSRYMLGSIYKQQNDLQSAQRQYEEILRLNPESIAAQMELATVHMARGATEPARAAAEVAAKARPRNIDAQIVLLRSLIASGDVARADPLMTALVGTAGDRGDLQWMAGMLQLRKGNRTQARAYFDRALTLQPDAIEPLDGLIALDLASGQGAAARARIDAQLRARPKSAGLLMLAARVYSTLEDFPAAERAAKAAITIDPREPAAYEQLMRGYASQGQLERGLRELEAMAQRDPAAAGPPIMIGVILQAQKRPSDAQAWFEKALAIDPRSPVVAANLAWLYAEQGGDLDEALRLGLLAKSQLPERPEIDDTLGWVYYKRGNIARAIPLLEQSVNRDPQRAVYQYHLGLAYAKAGDTANARAALQLALRRDSGFEGAANARAVLASLQ
jgi:putative PEP-CTERM system TPR-repeat lipoprotein